MPSPSHTTRPAQPAATSPCAKRLDRKLAGVLEPEMRQRLVYEALIAAGPEGGAALLDTVLTRRPLRGTTLDPLREALHEVLAKPATAGGLGHHYCLDYTYRRALYEAASRAGSDVVMRVLHTLPAKEELESPERQLPRDLADIPLGRRRSLARGGDPRLLEQLVLDPDTVVIAHLLRNPRTREQDVLRIAALRPVAGSTLAEIHRAKRWSIRPGIRVALARNPYCPVEIALQILGSIPLLDLAAMRRDPDLHAETQRQVEAEWARRQPA